MKPWIAINLAVLLFVSAKLQLESTIKDSVVGVRIRSVTENSYLCVNPNGDLTVEVSLLSIVKSSATRFTWPSTPTFLYADNTQLYICCCSKADSSAIQVGSRWGGWSLFTPSLPASYWKQSWFLFLFGRLKLFFLLSIGAWKYFGPLRISRTLIPWAQNISVNVQPKLASRF